MPAHLLRNRLAARLVAAVLMLGVLALAPNATAQSRREPDASDRIARLFFAPELVMRHQAELGLTRDQKDVLVVEMQKAQSDLVPLQLEMAEIAGEFARLLSQARVDEQAAVAAARRVMALESQTKTRHLILLVRIKNMLSANQQTMLRRMRRQQWEQRRNGGTR